MYNTEDESTTSYRNTIGLISYLGKDTRPLRTLGNLNRTYNMPKQYSRSTNDGGTSKKSCVVRTLVFSSRLSLFFLQDRVVQTFAFSSHPSCATTCHPHPTLLLLVQDLSTVNGSTMSFLLPYLTNNITFSMLPFSNNRPLSLS